VPLVGIGGWVGLGTAFISQTGLYLASWGVEQCLLSVSLGQRRCSLYVASAGGIKEPASSISPIPMSQESSVGRLFYL